MTFDRRTVLAFVVVLSFVGITLLWVLRPPNLTPEQMNVATLILGALIGKFGDVINFDFGSSSGSKAKDDALISATRAGSGDMTVSNSTIAVEPAKAEERAAGS